jgi:hypothetical protein
MYIYFKPGNIFYYKIFKLAFIVAFFIVKLKYGVVRLMHDSS